MRYLERLASAIAVSALLGVAGCGAGTVCEEAVDKLVGECEMGGGAAIDNTIGECADERECNARCIMKSSCNSITAPASEAGSYHECLAECATPTP